MMAVDSEIEATLAGLLHSVPGTFPKVAHLPNSSYSDNITPSLNAYLFGYPVLLWIIPQLLIFKKPFNL